MNDTTSISSGSSPILPGQRYPRPPKTNIDVRGLELPFFTDSGQVHAFASSHRITIEGRSKKGVEAIAINSHLKEIANRKGLLAFHENGLVMTTNLALAKETFQAAVDYLNRLEGRLDPSLLKHLQERLIDQKLQTATHAMPAPTLTKLLNECLKTQGLSAALELLDQLREQKTEQGYRFGAVDPWPTTRETPYLHIIPNLQPVAGTPPTQLTTMGNRQSVLLNMIEPSLESSFVVNGKEISNAELLVIHPDSLKQIIQELPVKEQTAILDHKANLEAFYKNKASFSFNYSSEGGSNKTLMITVPTSRYVPNQFIAICTTDRKDLLEIVEEQKSQAGRFIEEASKKHQRRHSVASYLPEPITEEKAKEIIKEVETTLNPNSIIPNNSNIESIAHLLQELPEDSLVAQNAFDASTDAHYQHLQIFTHLPSDLVPCFTAPSEVKFEIPEKGIQFSRVRPETFHGTIYKMTVKTDDKETISCLKKIQDQFLGAETNGSSLNLIGRKTADGYEYYFVLRKSIIAHPQLQEAAKQMGITRPGWAEMIGIRIGNNADFFRKYPDSEYTGFLQTFAVEPKECVTFEGIAKTAMRELGSLDFNLLENSLRALRSDAETSQMVHCLLLSGSHDPQDALRLIMNAPDEMQPNLFITQSEGQSFESLTNEIAEKLKFREDHGKKYGVVAIDENVLASLPEFRLIRDNIDQLKRDFLGGSFKAFLLDRYPSNPLIKNLSDVDVERFLEVPIPMGEIHLHEALMRGAGGRLNTRTSVYEYGNTTLIDRSTPIDLEKVKQQQEKAILLGGNKFNTSPPDDAVSKVNEAGMKTAFISILQRYATSQETINQTVDLILEMDEPKNTLAVKKSCDLLNSWIKEVKQNPQLDIVLPNRFISQVRVALSSRIAEKMMPIYQHKLETYNLRQLGWNQDQVPPQFQHEGRLVPCDFKSYYTPDLTSVCGESVSFDVPILPTGKKIAVVMNGGQASGVADVAIGAILTAGPQNDVHIFVHGNEGLAKGESIRATLDDLPLIRSQGGFPGGTTRVPLADQEKVKENIKQFDGVIFIGGDGSYRQNKDVFVSAGVPVYFCIKTIDGDFQVEDTDFTLGYYTAIEGYGEMIENRLKQAQKNGEIHFVQVGGRYAGFLAVGTSAILPEEARPNLAIYPEEVKEKGWTFKYVVDVLAATAAYRMADAKPYGLFSLAEGTIQELPEVINLVAAIKQFKQAHPDISEDNLKEALKGQLKDMPPLPGCLSLYETLMAFSDEDVKLIGKPDPLGRIPFAQIDSYAAFGRLVERRLGELKASGAELVEEPVQLNETLLKDPKLALTVEQRDRFLQTPIPRMKGVKSNYDQRSKPAIKRDYQNGLMQGMAAASAALFGTTVEGQPSAIIATSSSRDNVVAISTKVKSGGELISPEHPYVAIRNRRLAHDLIK